ncbi:hypothetical protein QJQ45_023718 [Haematococcus lacustris]|nr:hypothetical protein QJQ45_023718 [Haematococcus lacustris]
MPYIKWHKIPEPPRPLPGSRSHAEQHNVPGNGLATSGQPTTSPGQALLTAAQLASLAGPDVGIRGPYILGRQRPVYKRVANLAGMFGQSSDPWWRWRRWLMGLRRAGQQPTRQGTGLQGSRQGRRHSLAPLLPGHLGLAAARPGVLASAAEPSDSGLPGMRVTALNMDDAELDLDQLEEGVTADMLASSAADMEERSAHALLEQLRALAALHHPIPAPSTHGATPSRFSCGSTPRAPPSRPHPGWRSPLSPQRLPPGPPYLTLFKGGGFVAADLSHLIERAGLQGVLRLQGRLEGADCIVCKARWRSGKRVDLRQLRSAALNRGIPLLLLRSLRLTNVLLTLRPLLVDQGLVRDTHEGRQRLCMRKDEWDAGLPEAGAPGPLSTAGTPLAPSPSLGSAAQGLGPALDDAGWGGVRRDWQLKVLSGRMSVAEFALRSRLPGEATNTVGCSRTHSEEVGIA